MSKAVQAFDFAPARAIERREREAKILFCVCVVGSLGIVAARAVSTLSKAIRG